MPFKITCPNGHAMRIHDAHAGRRVKCPTCSVGLLATPPNASTPPPGAPPAGLSILETPPPPLIFDAELVEEPEAAPAPPAEPAVPEALPEGDMLIEPETHPAPPRKPKKIKRSRKQIAMTRGLALISTGLMVQTGRIAFLALAFIVGFAAVFAPVGGSFAGLGVGAVAHLLGLAVAGLCLGGSRQTGGMGLIIASAVADFFGIPVGFLLGWLVAGEVGAVIGVVCGAVCKVVAWFLFVLYLRTLALYFGEEGDVDLADGLLRFTFLILGEYVVFFAVAVIPVLANFKGAEAFRDLIALWRIMQILFLIATVWFIIHCVWYLMNYIQVLLELIDTIRNQGVVLGDMFQTTSGGTRKSAAPTD